MPRIANLTNFDGDVIATQPWVLEQLTNIEAGSTSIFISNYCDTENLNTYVGSLEGPVKGNVMIIKDGTAKGSYIFTDNERSFEKLVFDDSVITSSLNQNTTDINTIKTNFNKIVNEVETGVFVIKPSALPALAINESYTINASSENYKELGVLDLIKQAVGGSSVQRGDLIIITATDQARAEAVAGNYIIIDDIEDPDSLTTDNYLKLYSGTGTVVSVNGVGPVNGDITLGFSNLDDTNITYNESVGEEPPTIQSISIKETEIALKSSVDEILELIGTGFSSEYTIKDAIDQALESSGANDRISILEDSLNLVESQINNNIAAINKAVQLVETTFQLIDGISGVQISSVTDGTGTYKLVTITTTGHVLQVWDDNGKVVLPDITYTEDGNVSLTARYNSDTIKDTKWVVLRTVPIEVVIVESSDSSDDSIDSSEDSGL